MNESPRFQYFLQFVRQIKWLINKIQENSAETPIRGTCYMTYVKWARAITIQRRNCQIHRQYSLCISVLCGEIFFISGLAIISLCLFRHLLR